MAAFTTWFQMMSASVRPVRTPRPARYWEVDAYRGFAILIMVIYHLVWDLYGLGGWDIDVYTGFWHGWQLVTAGSFIFLVGVSMVLRAQRMQAQGRAHFRPFWQRGMVIFLWGMVISLVTWLFDPGAYVRFGILHFIGVAIWLAYPFLRWGWWNVFPGMFLLTAPQILAWRHDWVWMEWMGLARNPHPSFDYFPVIPWLGMVLLGIAVGSVLYPAGQRGFSLPDLSHKPWMRWLVLAGQNSLLLYLIHQPILITLLTLLGVVKL